MRHYTPQTLRVLSADFLKTATRRADWPPGPTPELAFVGRSNVGKSSLLNALSGREKLARVSSTPGRTQALQFFDLQVQLGPARAAIPLRLCDLPGYGYAKVSKADQARWAKMIEEYLKGREQLRAVVLIVDARHEPPASDREALGFLLAAGRQVVVAATKMDKLSKSHRFGAARAAEAALGLPRGTAVPCSAVEGTGTDALWTRLLELAQG